MGGEAKVTMIPKSFDEETATAAASVNIWKYVFGFTDAAVVKCAVDLGIPRVIRSNGGDSIRLSQLSSALGCGQDQSAALRRIMRFLAQRGFFTYASRDPVDPEYSMTPLSRLLLEDDPHSMARFILLEAHPTMLGPWQNLARHVLDGTPPFVVANGEDVWLRATGDREFGRLVDDAMACDARIVVPAIAHGCPNLFQGIGSVVDVGGGNGITMSMIVKAFPPVKGINFDLPHVVADAPSWEGVEHVGGDMFKEVPKADAAFLMWVLHDWSDDDCIHILRKCKDAIPRDGGGKVVIVEGVMEEEGEEAQDELSGVRLSLDMVMMAHTKAGRERTRKEWESVITQAGFSRIHITAIAAVQSVIEVFP
ncbi:hypothetical protein MLD38_023006 [Melastoma candidum]|uniref:Uncharacterized protein n=1 Tax=Melastoma candidum TaxID=119954 RepID=A0ACB9QL15_9MYRT|nr:hypothetical protein MLD38_023006 [Melastoma candidum]